jgi:CheY-like chemotaxis protein
MAQTILFIDDSRLVQEIYRQRLMQERFRVLIAGGGLEALRILSKETPDLILLDLLMPDVDGYRILEVVKREPRLTEVPVVIFSGKSQGAELQKAFDLGARDYIIKSTTPPNEVVQQIRRVLRETCPERRQYQLRIDPSLDDAPRFAAALGLKDLTCTACGAALALLLETSEDGGWQSTRLICSGCAADPQPRACHSRSSLASRAGGKS